MSTRSSVHYKEYILEVNSESQPLILRLTPANGSIAFISAIEVISIPDGLVPSAAATVPIGPYVNISTHLAFETIYRINVGGVAIGSKNDTFWRIWETDQPFLINPASVHTVSTDPHNVKYPPGIPSYTAPNLVYATAQEMADANVSNQKFNISWMFKVDSGFRYLVRLHFCDFISNNTSNLVFNVYMNNESALSSFGILSKAELSTAYIVDFVLNVQMETDKILVQIGPPQIMNVAPNAILNGLEIMKLSNQDKYLDASHIVNNISFEASKQNKRSTTLLITLTAVGAALLVFIVAMLLLCYRHYSNSNKKKSPSLTWLRSSIAPNSQANNSNTKISTRSYFSSGPSLGLGQLLAFSEIKQATNNFDENLVIGVGGFGKVYKGVLENGIVVAVKRGNPQSQQGLIEFRTEIEMLSKLRHRHLVSLIGYCHEPNEMVLVYEFMAGGPLRKHLYGSDLPPLSWKQRLEILIGAAKGLHYLHTGAAETIIHRDVKTTNILLDENFIAKVADFGLSKSGPTLDQTHVSTAVKGSFGYLDPEYFKRQQLTEKSDVYSFGVVLMEVLCARPAINPALHRDQVNIVEWAMSWQKRGLLERIIDPHLVGSVSIGSIRKFGETAEKCLSEYGIERPTMGDVLWNLEYALQLQESFAIDVEEGSSISCIEGLPEIIPERGNAERDMSSFVSGGTDAATSRVFSQLMDPKGR